MQKLILALILVAISLDIFAISIIYPKQQANPTTVKMEKINPNLPPNLEEIMEKI